MRRRSACLASRRSALPNTETFDSTAERTGPPEEKIVKLEPANRMLRRLFRKAETLEVEMQPIKAHETMRIGIDIEFEIVDDFRRDPTGTKFCSRKTRAVENDHIDTCLAELPCTGRSRRTPSNNQCVDALHVLLVAGALCRIQKLSIPRHIVIAVWREYDLIELQSAGFECSRRPGKV